MKEEVSGRDAFMAGGNVFYFESRPFLLTGGVLSGETIDQVIAFGEDTKR